MDSPWILRLQHPPTARSTFTVILPLNLACQTPVQAPSGLRADRPGLELPGAPGLAWLTALGSQPHPEPHPSLVHAGFSLKPHLPVCA